MTVPAPLRLGVNIDHVATVRNARGGAAPDPLRAALAAQSAGADGITAHLREDRRHIRDADIAALKRAIRLPLNFEMAATEEMRRIALDARPHAACIVPERREERTTEGGLDAARDPGALADFTAPLRAIGCRVSLFIEADPAQIDAAVRAGADIVELHAGAFCEAHLAGDLAARERELDRLRHGARLAAERGLEVHAGHGLTFDTVESVAAMPQVVELNIGHFLISEAIFVGLESAIRDMRARMDRARAAVGALL